MLKGRSTGWPWGRVPEPRRQVRAPGQDGLGVRAEGHGKNVALMPKRTSEVLVSGHVPQLGYTLAPRQGDLAIAAESNRSEPIIMLQGFSDSPRVVPWSRSRSECSSRQA